MKKIYSLIIALTVSALSLNAQSLDLARVEMEKLQQIYGRSENVAGMFLDQPGNNSITTFGGNYTAGDHRRVQEGESLSGFTFKTERYDKFNEILAMRGSFRYDYGIEKNRIWSDVMDPFNSNPFIFGSQVAKDYESQTCALALDLYTKPLADLVSTGLKFRYDVSDISGKRDPRPRTNYLTYTVAPSFLVVAGRHQFGANAGYVFSKEKLNNLTTVQSYPNLWYYTMSGLEHCDGSIGSYSGFKRQFVGNGFVAGIQYGYRSEAITYLLEGGLDAQWQNVWGDKKQSPGTYQRNIWKLHSDLIINGSKVRHNFLIDGMLSDGGTDEYIQELQSSKNPVTGATTETWTTLYTYHNRFVRIRREAKMTWKTFGLKQDGSSHWSAGAHIGYNALKDEHHLPHSLFGVDILSGGVEGRVRAIDRKGHRLEISGEAEAGFTVGSDLSLSVESIYGNEVILPDFRYFSRNTVTAHGEIRWTFPLKFGKNSMQGYLAAKGGNIFAGAFNRYDASLTLGLITF